MIISSSLNKITVKGIDLKKKYAYFRKNLTDNFMNVTNAYCQQILF